MKKRIIGSILIVLMLAYLLFLPTENLVKAKTVNAVVKHSRNVYYQTNSKLKSYKENSIDGEYMEYWDMKNILLVKAVTYPTSSADCYIKNYTVEYYYDKNQRLVFAFAYRKVNAKKKEYRAYYGTNGKLYRYIDSNGKIKSFKRGHRIEDKKDLKYELYRKGMYYLNLAKEGFN